MGIQRKSKRSLLDLIESQPGKDALGKSTQPQLSPPPPKFPLPPPQPSLPPRVEPIDPKRKREQKGKEVLKVGRPLPMLKEETQQAAKQQKTRQAWQRGSERRENQTYEPQAWLPAPMLNGEPLRDNDPSGIFVEVMDATWPRLWRRLYYSPMTWPSCGLSGGMRFSLTSKDIWAWYAPIPLFFFVFTSYGYL